MLFDKAAVLKFYGSSSTLTGFSTSFLVGFKLILTLTLRLITFMDAEYQTDIVFEFISISNECVLFK